MVYVERVCCMCGDVGFPDNIFRCINCHHRFQHSYCSNYYSESSGPPELCNWCQTDQVISRTAKPGGSSKKLSSKAEGKRSGYLGSKKMKQEDGSDQKGKSICRSSTGAPSPKTTTRRYKLLKDVMC